MGAQERNLAGEPATTVKFRDELQPGTSLMHGQYTVRDFLGADGFGITYLASDSLDRLVAIKECFPGAFCRREGKLVQPRSAGHAAELDAIVRLFAEEAKKLSAVGHPNIVGIHNVFEENNTAYIAMDFVDGRDLREIIADENEALTSVQIQRYLDKTLDAVNYFHRCGILHRDVSPGNIIIREEDGEPVLIDFGAARDQATKASRILSILRVVKDGYAPQEYYISGSEQGPSSDLYSLAATFYHLITGSLPPGSQQRVSDRASGKPDPYIPLAELTTDFSDDFCAALDKALAIIAEDRHQSAEEWFKAMRPEEAAKVPKMQLRMDPHHDEAGQHDQADDSEVTSADLDGSVEAADTYDESEPEREAPKTGEATRPVPVAAETQPISYVEEELAFTDPVAGRSRGRAAKLFLAGTSMIAFAGVAIFAYPKLVGSNVSFEVVSMAPTMAMPSLENEGLPGIASFEPVERTDPPVLTAVAVVAQDHGVSAAMRAGPIYVEPEMSETVEVATSPVQSEGMPEASQFAIAEAPQPLVTEEAPAGAEIAEAEEAVSTPVVALEETASAAPAVVMPAPILVPEIDLAALPPQETPSDTARAPTPSDPGVSGLIEVSNRPILPFEADPSDPGLVGEVKGDAPAWMESGLRVVSVDGKSVNAVEEVSTLIAESLEPGATEVDVMLGVQGPLDQTETVRVVTVPVVHEMRLPNGLRFESRFENGKWTTWVTNAPAEGTLIEGDVMIGIVRDLQPFEGPDAMRQAIEAQFAGGSQGIAFAVEREGALWVETLMLPSL